MRAEDGRVTDTLAAAYRGMGLYEAKRVFPTSEAGKGRVYLVTFRFTDPATGAHVQNETPYRLAVQPGV